MPGNDRILLGCIFSISPAPNRLGAWRLPRSYNGFSFMRPDYWEHIGRTMERGRLDFAFFADSFNLHDDYGHSPATAIRYAVQYPRLDPIPFITAMSRVTRGLGFGVTGSTTYLQPYWLARMLATMDHVTDGRMGWNVVTSFGQNEAANFGLSETLTGEQRYERAHEYIELCSKLWDSWEPDAVLMNRATGEFADPAKVKRFMHKGKYFSCPGPLSVPRSPQGRPVIIQAGASATGVAFAARHAEMTFAERHTAEGLKDYSSKMRAALVAAGRKPEDAKIVWGTTVIVGETEHEARARENALMEAAPPEAVLAMLSGLFGIDLSVMPLDEPVRNLGLEEKAKGVTSHVAALAKDYGPDFTLREAAAGGGLSLQLTVTGTPEQVANRLEELHETGGGDGFMLRPVTMPGSIDDFVDLVVPILRARGRLPARYDGATFRANLFQA